jgi:hypothetical protein
VKKITADVAAIPLKWSTKSQPLTMLVAILRGAALVGSFAKQFPALKSAAEQAAFVLRILDTSWRQLIAKVGEGSPTWTGGAQQQADREIAGRTGVAARDIYVRPAAARSAATAKR